MTIEVPHIAWPRAVFCNRTLNLRSIKAIGYDMDYTLVQYHVVEWEELAYGYAKKRLLEQGWPVESLVFDPELMIQGLIVDIELGNLIKANRFGYVKTVFHGSHPLDFDQQRKIYDRTLVDHRDGRFVFLSTMFSLSEACLFAQLVDLWDAGNLPAVLSYADLYSRVRATIDDQHREGRLKEEVARNFERYVEIDPTVCETLLDQRDAGKKLLLITNSDWLYTRAVMQYAFDSFLPQGMTWRDLFDVVIVSARKPDFFSSRSPLLEIVDDTLLREVSSDLISGTVYFGGNAALVERHLGLTGAQLLYVGDHFFGDVHATKITLRWRTALVVREIEGDIKAEEDFADKQCKLDELMREKEDVERQYCHVRMLWQRLRKGRGGEDAKAFKQTVDELRGKLENLDHRIAPLAQASSRLSNENWGPLMRAGNDKSYLANLVERHADIYMSRVSNLYLETPFAYFRSARGTLPHDAPRRSAV